jgi:hypothetical protein
MSSAIDIPFQELGGDSKEVPLLKNRPSFRAQDVDHTREHKLGLWMGVYMPTVLNCLSVVFYLRWGYIVGTYGLWLSYGMLFFSEIVVFLTILSVSALVTNGRVKGGGAYCIRLIVYGFVGVASHFPSCLSLT